MDIHKKHVIISCTLLFLGIIFPFTISAQKSFKNSFQDLDPIQAPLIPAPSDTTQWKHFKKSLLKWREQIHEKVNYNASLYDREDFQWIRSSFNCCFLMMYDQRFYDRNNNCYTIDKILVEGQKRFGGYDIVVLWHAYPRIGLDPRNQFDFYRDMPGGLNALKEVANKTT